MIKVDRLDHLVLTVQNVEKTCQFYAKALGIKSVTFGSGSKALCLGAQRIKLQQRGQESEPKAGTATPGSGDFCFITQTDLEQVVQHLVSCNIEVIDGPIRRSGTNGPMTSIYFRDPDLNLVQVSAY